MDHRGGGDLVAMTRRARELGTPVDWLVRAKHNRELWSLICYARSF
jgi:hypothetical protein